MQVFTASVVVAGISLFVKPWLNVHGFLTSGFFTWMVLMAGGIGLGVLTAWVVGIYLKRS